MKQICTTLTIRFSWLVQGVKATLFETTRGNNPNLLKIAWDLFKDNNKVFPFVGFMVLKTTSYSSLGTAQ